MTSAKHRATSQPHAGAPPSGYGPPPPGYYLAPIPPPAKKKGPSTTFVALLLLIVVGVIAMIVYGAKSQSDTNQRYQEACQSAFDDAC